MKSIWVKLDGEMGSKYYIFVYKREKFSRINFKILRKLQPIIQAPV